MNAFPAEIPYYSKLVKVGGLLHQLWLLSTMAHQHSENSGFRASVNQLFTTGKHQIDFDLLDWSAAYQEDV